MMKSAAKVPIFVFLKTVHVLHVKKMMKEKLLNHVLCLIISVAKMSASLKLISVVIKPMVKLAFRLTVFVVVMDVLLMVPSVVQAEVIVNLIIQYVVVTDVLGLIEYAVRINKHPATETLKYAVMADVSNLIMVHAVSMEVYVRLLNQYAVVMVLVAHEEQFVVKMVNALIHLFNPLKFKTSLINLTHVKYPALNLTYS